MSSALSFLSIPYVTMAGVTVRAFVTAATAAGCNAVGGIAYQGLMSALNLQSCTGALETRKLLDDLGIRNRGLCISSSHCGSKKTHLKAKIARKR
jgi:hypothetical protein